VVDIGPAIKQGRRKKLIEGRPVLIIDDIHDRGKTLEVVTNKIQEKYCPSSVEHCVMIKRVCDKCKTNVKPKFIGFTISVPDFLVGMGLDYKGDYRFLPYIGTVDPDFNFKTGIIEENICNKCGISCTSPDARRVEGPLPSFYGLVDATVGGYYFSPVLEDCTTYKFDICEKCLKEIFNSFVIPVEER